MAGYIALTGTLVAAVALLLVAIWALLRERGRPGMTRVIFADREMEVKLSAAQVEAVLRAAETGGQP